MREWTRDEVGDLVSRCGKFRIVSGMLSDEERARGLACSLLFHGRWLGDFESTRAAKEHARKVDSKPGGA